MPFMLHIVLYLTVGNAEGKCTTRTFQCSFPIMQFSVGNIKWIWKS